MIVRDLAARLKTLPQGMKVITLRESGDCFVECGEPEITQWHVDHSQAPSIEYVPHQTHTRCMYCHGAVADVDPMITIAVSL